MEATNKIKLIFVEVANYVWKDGHNIIFSAYLDNKEK